ncbi:CopG family transcriptional regulator [Burkholderia pyrrocinia]|uniref:CopG family transcriptional regulator n=1 Tax=Burkholderia pyrrocinia TaxID=60550 RepID=A0A2Z5N2J0_BURPY|nr:CopG family transcriptional regulator [Burkholderia pyrrocinia]AXF23813.1 CopG family transcriptional regulator [Burkholderia pyrrocinia]
MTRVPVDLSDDLHAALTIIAAINSSSPAEIIRDAIDAYITQHAVTLADDVFGLWKGRAVAGLESLRSEW